MKKTVSKKTALLLALIIIIRTLPFCIAFVFVISAAAGCIGESSGITNTENYVNETPEAKRAVLGYVSRKTGINVSDGEIIFGFDDHGGFHGDGELYLEIQTPYSLDNELIGNPLWKSAPIPEKIKNIIEPVTKDFIYSHVNPEESYDDSCVFPDIKNGWYCFIDRRPEHTDEFMNYSFALYDPQTKTIYYLEEDS